MPRKAKPLTALEVGRITAPGMHAVGTVAGLHLLVKPTGARSWILRATVGGKRRDIGLGGFPDVPLADAHRKAREAREAIEKGADPILARAQAKSALRATQAAAITFDRAAELFLDAKGDEWRNAKHRAQWAATLNTYALPKIGAMLVADVKSADVLAVLSPIWREKTETASRLRGRIESVISYAVQAGYRPQGLNPARWKGNLDMLLPKPSKVARVVHHAALPYADMGDFMAGLKKHSGTGAAALRFAILTAARSGEVRGATWAEIDVEAGVWTIPAERMKADKEHRVPLSPQALELLRELPRLDGTEFVFPASRKGQLSDMTLTAAIRRMGHAVTAHGFRSTFRDWAVEQTAYPSEVVEMALAHAIGNKVEAAYRRGDLFEKRRRLMADWADYCDAPSATAGTVHPLRKAS
jgi:integrase